MKIILPCLINLAVLLTFNAASAQEPTASFAAHHTTLNPVASVSQIQCSMDNGRTLLKWNIVNNEAADQFAVEASTDGKNFQMVALVFGTEKEKTDDYFFFEKTKKKKTYYRLKIVNKDKTVQYSSIVTP